MNNLAARMGTTFDLRANPAVIARRENMCTPPSASLEGFRQIEWYRDVATKPDEQTQSSCTFNAFMTQAEMAAHRLQHRTLQYGYDELYYNWRKARGDMADTGALLPNPAKFARETAALPPDSAMVYGDLSGQGICDLLERGPLAIGMSVHDGFAPEYLHTDNGAVAENLGDGVSIDDNLHAMVLIATNIHNGVALLVCRQSWGRLGPGGQGVICFSLQHFLERACDYPLLIEFGRDWPTWKGMDRYIKEAA